MLTIKTEEQELFNDNTQEFITVKGRVVQLEHSLVSLSKWESKYHKAFLTKKDKTREETIEYIRCMMITQNVDEDFYMTIDNNIINQVSEYIQDPMTATKFSSIDERRKVNNDVITAEVIYYWMIALQVPMECQKWHLNRLLTLINVCNIKNQPKTKMSKKQLMARNSALNAERRQRLNTRG